MGYATKKTRQTEDKGYATQKNETNRRYGKICICPEKIRVKAEENLKAKSLKAFCDKYKPKYAVRTSMSDFRQQDWMTNIPLYNIDKISEILDE